MIDSLLSYFNDNPDLPGHEAHRLMSPNGRPKVKDLSAPENARLSAILILLHEKSPGDIYTTLIQRPEYDGTHSKQIAFPGGKQEENEELLITALRETEEEIGIHRSSIEVLGELSDIYIPPSNFLVSPFLGITHDTPSYTPDPIEVDEVFEFPLQLILDDDIVKETTIPMSNGLRIKAPYFEINNKVVWGATAAMLSELKEILKLL